MKIDSLNTALNNLPGTSPRVNKSAAGSAESLISSNVQLSGQALDAKSTTEVFDNAKVEQIRAAIAEGRFQVNAGAVADSLIQTARDLVLTQSRSA